MLYDSSLYEEWETKLADKKIVGVCRDGEKYRAYLHIGDKQVWSQRGFVYKAEAANARLEAEQRFFNRTRAVKSGKRLTSAIRSPKEAQLFEGVRCLPSGRFEAFRMVRKPSENEKEVRFVEQHLGDFDESYFQAYLEMYKQIEKLRKDMLEFSQQTLIPLLQLAPARSKKRKVYRSILGYRWEQVRRYRTVTIHTSAGKEKIRELSGIYLRLVKEKE